MGRGKASRVCAESEERERKGNWEGEREREREKVRGGRGSVLNNKTANLVTVVMGKVSWSYVLVTCSLGCRI